MYDNNEITVETETLNPVCAFPIIWTIDAWITEEVLIHLFTTAYPVYTSYIYNSTSCIYNLLEGYNSASKVYLFQKKFIHTF